MYSDYTTAVSHRSAARSVFGRKVDGRLGPFDQSGNLAAKCLGVMANAKLLKQLGLCGCTSPPQAQESWVKSASVEQHLTLDCSWCLPANPATPHQLSFLSSPVPVQPHFCCRRPSGRKWRSRESVTTHISAHVPSNKLGPPGFCSLIRVIRPNAISFAPGHPI